MKFTVERDALAEAVAWVARALPSRPVIPVLSGLLLEAEDDLTLSCFDYEVSARMSVPASVDEPGTALVPGRLLAEITRSLPGLPAEFADDPDGVSLTCGEASFTLVTLQAAEYPALPELPQLAGTADGGALAAAIGQVAPAASRDDTLPMLTGVSVELEGETITLAATDRYRLAVRELAWNPALRERTAVMVPARTLSDAARMMGPGMTVRIMLREGAGQPGPAGPGGRIVAAPAAGSSDAMIGFEAGGRRLTTRLLAGEFIKYRSRFPAEFGCTADLPATAFTEAVRRVSLVAERGSPVRLSFGPGRVTVDAGTQGHARARESVPAEFTGEEPVIAFNPHYLLDGIAAATTPIPPNAATSSAPHHGSPQPSSPAEQDASIRDAPPRAAAPRDEPDEAGQADETNQTERTQRRDRTEGTQRPDGTTVADGAITRVRLQFTSATKPAVLTGTTDSGSGPDFRYLVVPQRVQQ
ncbi:MAG: DNA polymerase III subunit beta [Streptosporangiaceae bacterium]|nr:DNA polymerase III subunit beta [Streptosporangiaceae bacterium]MBV9852936.1 DNA polymerase III subunit beta [Streptosporangiaceae bacterium]